MLKERQKEIWAARVFSLRFNLGLTQEAFGTELGVSRQAVNQWENGIYVPGPSIRKQIVEIEAQNGLNGLSHAS
jgi:transcriptional regulator with XRE-family HTH domain